jgi:hypothetical protein
MAALVNPLLPFSLHSLWTTQSALRGSVWQKSKGNVLIIIYLLKLNTRFSKQTQPAALLSQQSQHQNILVSSTPAEPAPASLLGSATPSLDVLKGARGAGKRRREAPEKLRNVAFLKFHNKNTRFRKRRGGPKGQAKEIVRFCSSKIWPHPVNHIYYSRGSLESGA